MISLTKLMEKLEYELLCGEKERQVSSLAYDSRKAEEDCVFVCISGALADGHAFIDEVIEKGAKAIVVSRDVSKREGVTILKVKDTRYALALMSAAYFGYPAEEMKLIGITGTKGKTTTSYMVKAVLDAAGYSAGLIGGIEILYKDVHIHAEHTTPESYELQKYFRDMADAGCECVVMEVSSQALMLSRTAGIFFDIGVFTNLEPDHIAPHEHANFEDYLHCKSLLFRQCRLGIFNRDDKHFEEILKGHTCQVETFGFSKEADLWAEDVRLITGSGYLGETYQVRGKAEFPIEVEIPGRFNIYNSLTAIAICRHFKAPVEKIQAAVKAARVKGRVEPVKVSDAFTLMIDYAHNAMSLESLLTSLREYNPKRLVCLFGCGGDRARDRRFEMGEVSGRLADFTILTSDNPRTEKPETILADIETGVKRTDGEYITIIDRKEAIKYAIENGRPGDVIVLAGKGHEDYQEINHVKYPMDERVLIQEILECMQT